MKTTQLLAVALMALMLAACGSADSGAATPEVLPMVVAEKTIVAEGRVEPAQYAEVAFNGSGRVSTVLVDEGEQVKKGQVLISLGDESDISFAAAQLELVTAQQALNDLVNSSGSDLAQTVIDLKDAREAYDKAENYLRYLQTSEKIPQTELQRQLIQTWKGYSYSYKTKSFKGPAPEDWIIEATNDLALKRARLDEVQRAYDRMKDGVDVDQLALLEARLVAAKAGVAAFSVVAPFDGVVAKLNAKVGESIGAGRAAVTIADFSSWFVKTTDLTELDVVNIVQGQPVNVSLDALPGTALTGRVESIAQTFIEKQGDVVYEVVISLDKTDPAMLWGMTAVVNFQEPED